MINKILIIIAFTFSGYCLANNDCEIKPILQAYQATKIDNSIHSFIAKTNKEAIFIDVPYPKMIRPISSIYIYNKTPLKSILFFTENRKMDGYEVKDFYLKMLGATHVEKQETAIFNSRFNSIDCNNLPIEIKLNSDEYRTLLLLNKYSDNLFIIPKGSQDRKVYIVQFTGFTIDELNIILGTLKIEKE